MARDFDHGASGGAWTSWTVVLGCWPADRLVRSSQRQLVAIGLGNSLERHWLTGSAGGVLPGCEQKFGLDVKEAGFDRAGPPKSPQQAC